MRGVFFLFVLGVALAGPCAQRPYTLETEEGLLGGENLTYDGETLVLEGRACLEREGLFLEAPVLRYREEEGFFVEGPKGEVEGWALSAERLEGKTLRGAVLKKGRLEAKAEEVRLEKPPVGKGVLLSAPAYRVKAEEALFQREEVLLKGFLATPCPCGEDVRLEMAEARFDPSTGELKGDARLGLYGLEIPLEDALANANRRPDLKVPLLLSASESGGMALGVDGLPLPRPGEEVGAWSLRLTLVALRDGSGREALRLGVREGRKGGEVRLGHGAYVQAFFEDLFFAASPAPPDASTPRLEARYAPSLALGGLSLRPFLRYAETASAQGWTLGLEGNHRFSFQEGPFRLTLSPTALLALYHPQGEAYAALGGSVTLAYREGPLSLEAAYAGRYEPLGKEPLYAYEDRDEFQRFALRATHGGLSLDYTLENPLGNRLDRLEGAYEDPALGTFRAGFFRGSYAEVRLGYAMPLPDRACCQALWAAPEMGFGEGALSRYGLTLRYYDGCLAYELRFQNVLRGQYDEATGPSLSVSATLR
ncbi:hypothetical protein [Thermus oshimai]|nr:hypothetical protein [Thermus oshimai]